MKTLRLSAAAALAVLLTCTPALAQRVVTTNRTNDETRNIDVSMGRTSELRIREPVTVNEDGDWITGIGEGGRFIVELSDRHTDERVEFTRRNDGRMHMTYTVNGTASTMTAAARARTAAMISRAVRDFGMGAEDRVGKLRLRGGVGAVLREVEALEDASVKRRYLDALQRGASLTERESSLVAEARRRLDTASNPR